jgi:hypothetical protein
MGTVARTGSTIVGGRAKNDLIAEPVKALKSLTSNKGEKHTTLEIQKGCLSKNIY